MLYLLEGERTAGVFGFGADRSSVRYRSIRLDDATVRARLRKPAKVTLADSIRSAASFKLNRTAR